ncbi:hypothetical protein GCM10010441_37170 [Kitasatospora paracochleata]
MTAFQGVDPEERVGALVEGTAAELGDPLVQVIEGRWLRGSTPSKPHATPGEPGLADPSHRTAGDPAVGLVRRSW